VQLPEKLDNAGDHMCAGQSFLIPVQHQDPSSQAVHGVFCNP
jgi:hypothetical protein